MNKEIEAVAELAQKYFDALYHGDAGLFEELFHPEAHLYCNNGEDFVAMDVADYLDLVRNRANPVDRGQARQDEVLQIIVSTPTTAVLRTRELFLPKRFTDDLTLMKFKGKWRIIAKIWDFEVLN